MHNPYFNSCPPCCYKVGISGVAILEPWVQINGQLQSFQQKFGSAAPSAWIYLKTQFWGPLTNWDFEPSPKAHTHADPIINKYTEQVKKLRMDLSWHALNSMLQVKTLYHTEMQGFGYPWLSKKIPDTHQNPLKLSPVSERSAYPLQNYVRFSPLTSGLESFGHKCTPFDRPWIESKFLASTKVGGA